MAWSQGNLDTQWALKYWKSTRSKVSDFISISPDFHGTTESYLICLGLPGLACTPAVIQQEYSSNFVTTLRRNGGDSAYVPTTTIYSESDEVVSPQSGKGASAFMLDARNVGVSNTDIQITCGKNAPAAGDVTHEGVLYNSLAYALAVDALKNPGPGSLSRINVTAACSQIIAPGLDLADFLLTEGEFKLLLEPEEYPSQFHSRIVHGCSAPVNTKELRNMEANIFFARCPGYCSPNYYR
jgi:hypothetical protein